MAISTSFVGKAGGPSSLRGRVAAESGAVAVAAYAVAVTLETAIIRWLQPTELELASVSDLGLAVAFGSAVYLWRRLLTTRRDLAQRERTELVLQTQLSTAAEIQRRLLPALPARDRGLDCAAAMESAGKIGGDFYDFVESAPNVWTVLVADVSGKGIPAAMALGSLRSTFRTLAHQRLTPSQIVTQLSAAFFDEWNGTPYVTCIVARFNACAGSVTYSNAGHPRGLLLQSSGARSLAVGGPPAGLFPIIGFEEEVLPMTIGDSCVLVTDGVTEALEGMPSLDEYLASGWRRHRATDICADVMARALQGHGPAGDFEWDDDRTVVVVTMNGS